MKYIKNSSTSEQTQRIFSEPIGEKFSLLQQTAMTNCSLSCALRVLNNVACTREFVLLFPPAPVYLPMMVQMRHKWSAEGNLYAASNFSNALGRINKTIASCGLRSLPSPSGCSPALPGLSGSIVERCVLLASLKQDIPAAQM